MVDFSLFSVLECPPGRAARDVYREMLDLFAGAEDMGFRAAWVAEHHFSDYGTLGGPPVFLSALAARTRTLRVGAAISVLPFHDPIRVAEDYAVVDVISDGRLDFGVGRGYQPKEFKGFGVDMAEARDRFLESLDIIQTAWRDGYVDHDGPYYTYRDLPFRPQPVQKPVPTYVASVSPETFELVRRAGYTVMGSLLTNSAKQLCDKFTEHQATLPAGIVPRMPIMTPVYVADNMEAAIEQSLPEFTWYWETVGKLLPQKGEKMDASYAYFQRLGENTATGKADLMQALARWPVGDVDRVSDFLIDLCRRSGTDEIICFASIGAMPYAKAMRNLELIAGEVMPRVRAALAADAGRTATVGVAAK